MSDLTDSQTMQKRYAEVKKIGIVEIKYRVRGYVYGSLVYQDFFESETEAETTAENFINERN